MNGLVIGMLAETPVHPGAGRTVGFVDLPVAREAVTDYPVIVGSSLKGALRNHASESWKDKINLKSTFGEQENAGDLIVSDARLLLLPVRSLTGHFKWATCPYLLERFERDIQRAINWKMELGIKSPSDGKVLSNDTGNDNKMFLEEREFEIEGIIEPKAIDALNKLIPYQKTADRLGKQLVILSDNDFAWFAKYGLSINARNKLTEKKTSDGGLWYEETLPMDSLFYVVLFERKKNVLNEIRTLFGDHVYLQVGGNETVGQGWFSLKLSSMEAKK